MAKPLVICETVICKVNGITLLKLNNSGVNGGKDNDQRDQPMVSYKDEQSEPIDEDIEGIDNSLDEDQPINDAEEEDDEEYETICETGGNVFEMETVDTSIESVRQYVSTTRKNGKVWHTCRWTDESKKTCPYGSKWSGAMVNHIRSHLGIKPFRCPFCDKLFTIACNLKNHLRIHHGLKTKIVLNGGRRGGGHKTNTKRIAIAGQARNVRKTGHPQDHPPKLRVFKPSFVNGKAAGSAYAPQRRVLPKRNVKKSQRYVDFEEDFEDEDLDNNDDKDEELELEMDQEYNEEEAEEENRRFYEKTVEDVEENEEDDCEQFVIRRQYNKVLWWVCLWSPRVCKYRSHEKQEVLNHVKKHKNLNEFTCNHCGLSFANRQVLDQHQLSHSKHKFLRCNHSNCAFQTINEVTMKMHKQKHKRQKN